MKKIIFVLILLNCFGCTTEEDIFGVYVKIPSKYTIDSLFMSKQNYYSEKSIEKTFEFRQRIYRKSDGKLLFEHSGTWQLSGNGIHFNDIYWDNGQDPIVHSLSDGSFKKGLISWSTGFNGDEIPVDKGVNYIKVK